MHFRSKNFRGFYGIRLESAASIGLHNNIGKTKVMILNMEDLLSDHRFCLLNREPIERW